MDKDIDVGNTSKGSDTLLLLGKDLNKQVLMPMGIILTRCTFITKQNETTL